MTRIVTMSSPDMPCVIASLPTGAIKPHPAQARNIATWAISGLLFFCSVILIFFSAGKGTKN
jgi:hypothetical protein